MARDDEDEDAARGGTDTWTWIPDGSGGPAHTDGPDPWVGDDRYTTLRLVGRGGIGDVFSVHDHRLGRTIARKELRGEAGGARTTSSGSLLGEGRFLREARLTAGLEHPGIVPVYDAGRDAAGRPFYTMRLLAGSSLAESLAACTGPVDRMRLLPHLVDLAQAVAYAHARGIIHRDIKPANVVLGEYGETWLVDWGLAKAIGAPEDGPEVDESVGPTLVDLRVTSHGTVLGTPAYMSPEQGRGETDTLDARADVWSLGALLYEILVGFPPFSGTDAREVLRKVRAGTIVPVRTHEPTAPTELVAIAEKALSASREDRYPSAREMARDLEAWRSGLEVAAYVYSPLEIVFRFTRRHRSLLSVGAIAAAVVVGFAVLSHLQVREERDRAMGLSLEVADALAGAYAEKAVHLAEDGDRLPAALFAASSLVLAESPDARGVLARVGTELGLERIGTWLTPSGCLALAVDPSRDRALCGGPDGLVQIALDGATAPVASSFEGRTHAVAFAPDGSFYATAGRPKTVRLFDADGALVGTWPTHGLARAVSLTAGGARLAFGDGRTVQVVDRATGGVASLEVAGQVNAVAFSPDGAQLAIAASAADAGVWALGDDGAWHEVLHLPVHFQSGTSIAWSPDGAEMVVGCPGSDAHVFRVADGVERLLMVGHDGPIHEVAWSRDGFIATGSEDLTAMVWSARDGVRVADLPGHDGWSAVVAWTRDGRLLTASRAPLVAAWAGGVTPEQAARSGPGGAFEPRVAMPDPVVGVVIAGTAEGEVVALDNASRLVVWGQPIPPPLEAGRSRLLRAAEGGVIVVDGTGNVAFRSPDGALRWERPAGREAPEVAVVGPELWLAAARGPVERWSLADGASLGTVAGTEGARAVISSPDGRFVAGITREGPTPIFDAATHARVGQVVEDPPPRTLAFSPDGRLVAIALRDAYEVHLIDWRTGLVVARLVGHLHQITDLTFSSDGRRLASASWDRTVRVWAVQPKGIGADAPLLATLHGHQHHVSAVTFTRDGSALYSASLDGTVRRWDLTVLDAAGHDLAAGLRARHGLEVKDGRLVAVLPPD